MGPKLSRANGANALECGGQGNLDVKVRGVLLSDPT